MQHKRRKFNDQLETQIQKQSYINSNDALIQEFTKRRVYDKAHFFIAFMIFDAYYTMNKPDWANQENKDYRDSTEYRFAKHFKKYKKNGTQFLTVIKFKSLKAYEDEA